MKKREMYIGLIFLAVLLIAAIVYLVSFEQIRFAPRELFAQKVLNRKAVACEEGPTGETRCDGNVVEEAYQVKVCDDVGFGTKSDPVIRNCYCQIQWEVLTFCEEGTFCLDGACVALSSECGNEILELGEGCDDGNNVGGDGCSSDCAIENDPLTQFYCPQQVFSSDDPSQANGDNFGNAVALEGNVGVIGNYYDGGIQSGSVFVYRKIGSTWVEEQNLVASDPSGGGGFGSLGDQFGNDVDLFENMILVGAWLTDDACPEENACNSGAAYVFDYNGSIWAEKQKLIASDAEFKDVFGSSLSINRDWIVVGSPGEDGIGTGLGCETTPNPDELLCDVGAVYLYRLNGSEWIEEQKIVPENLAYGDHFGTSLDVDLDVLAVTTLNSVYVYRYNPGAGRWILEQELEEPVSGSFGNSIDVSGNIIAVGDNLAKRVYLFGFNGSDWSLNQEITSSDNSFGYRVSFDGNWLSIGALWANGEGELASGKVYLYRREGSVLVEHYQFSAPDGAQNSGNFGSDVAVDGLSALIGSSGHNGMCPSDDVFCHAGSAYFFNLDGSDSDGDGVVNFCENN